MNGFLDMKRIFIFGRIVRISFLISFAFAIYAFIDIYFQSNFGFTNLLLLIFVVIVVSFGLIWIYSFGFYIDNKNDILKVVTEFSKKGIRERTLSNVDSIDVELNEDIGFKFIIHYKYDCKEIINYRFYRISFVEKLQYKRLKKELANIKGTNY